MKKVLHIKVYLLGAFLLIIIGAFFLMNYDKTGIHLAINNKHNSFFDFIFKYGTHLGDGLFTAIAVIPIGIIAFKKYRYSTFVLGWGTLIMSGILSQGLKRLVYSDALRPLGFIGEGKLYLVPGVDVHTMHSFPSGHTTAAFAFYAFASMVLFRRNKWGQLLMLLIAGVAGYSRMYLSQHFLEDVVTGIGLGLVSFVLVYGIVQLIGRKGTI